MQEQSLGNVKTVLILLVLLASGCATTQDRSINQVLTETKTKKQSKITCPKETIKACINFRCACYKRKY